MQKKIKIFNFFIFLTTFIQLYGSLGTKANNKPDLLLAITSRDMNGAHQLIASKEYSLNVERKNLVNCAFQTLVQHATNPRLYQPVSCDYLKIIGDTLAPVVLNYPYREVLPLMQYFTAQIQNQTCCKTCMVNIVQNLLRYGLDLDQYITPPLGSLDSPETLYQILYKTLPLQKLLDDYLFIINNAQSSNPIQVRKAFKKAIKYDYFSIIKKLIVSDKIPEVIDKDLSRAKRHRALHTGPILLNHLKVTKEIGGISKKGALINSPLPDELKEYVARRMDTLK